MNGHATEVGAAVAAALAEHDGKPGPLLVVLHAVQESLGYIPDDAIPLIAAGLNLSRADVHGVITFYHHFRRTPPGRHVIYLCRAEACQSMQSASLHQHATTTLGADFHHRTADGLFSIEPVYCLGNCALAPAMMIDERVYGRVTPARFDAAVAACRSRS
jgi:formate dehydrogenase subunit gamma